MITEWPQIDRDEIQDPVVRPGGGSLQITPEIQETWGWSCLPRNHAISRISGVSGARQHEF